MTRSGNWVTNKFSDNGLPFDIVRHRRAAEGLFGGKRMSPQFDHVIYRYVYMFNSSVCVECICVRMIVMCMFICVWVNVYKPELK